VIDGVRARGWHRRVIDAIRHGTLRAPTGVKQHAVSASRMVSYKSPVRRLSRSRRLRVGGLCARALAHSASVTTGLRCRIIGPMLPAITHRAVRTTVGYRSEHTWIREALKICSQSAPSRNQRATCGSFHPPRSTKSRHLHIQRRRWTFSAVERSCVNDRPPTPPTSRTQTHAGQRPQLPAFGNSSTPL
jgi:hypothetical protein